MRCDTMQYDAMRCNTMRCDAMPLSLLLIVWAVQGEEALGRGLFAVSDVVFPHFGFLRAYRFSLFV